MVYLVTNAQRGTVVFAPIGGTAATPGVVPASNIARASGSTVFSFQITDPDDLVNAATQCVTSATPADFQYSLDPTNWCAPLNGDASGALIGFTNIMASTNNWDGPTNSFRFYSGHPDVTNRIGAGAYYARFHVQAVVTQTNNISGTNFTTTGYWVTSEKIREYTPRGMSICIK